MRAIIMTLLVSLLPACAWAGKKENPPDTRAIMALMGRFSSAHGCPVGAEKVLTSGHVIDLRPFDTGIPLYPYQFSNGFGEAGVVRPIMAAGDTDVGLMEPAAPLTNFFTLAEGPPVPGESLWFVGYNYGSRSAALAEEVFRVTVVRVVANHIIMSDGGPAGSSGSCVLDVFGRVVGINEGWIAVGGGGAKVGIAVGVWNSTP